MIDKLRPVLYGLAALLLFLRGYTDAALVLVGLAVLFAVFFYWPSEEERK